MVSLLESSSVPTISPQLAMANEKDKVESSIIKNDRKYAYTGKRNIILIPQPSNDIMDPLVGESTSITSNFLEFTFFTPLTSNSFWDS
ncbi:hypothetical protein MMC14_007920 [Varicellaria rhodocarpa]|nr:hypothetical protein [Varicellaria rhodocarpa]